MYVFVSVVFAYGGGADVRARVSGRNSSLFRTKIFIPNDKCMRIHYHNTAAYDVYLCDRGSVCIHCSLCVPEMLV